MHHLSVAVLLVAMFGQLAYASECHTVEECRTVTSCATSTYCCWDPDNRHFILAKDCCCVNYQCSSTCADIEDSVKTAGAIVLVVIIGSIVCCIVIIVVIVYCCIKSSQPKTIIVTNTAQPMHPGMEMHQPMNQAQPYNAMQGSYP
ncbi:UPF0029 [Diplonema papillatum]|nr:UPF0029 [Diplonema papillatum]